jgi:hypothetical protein
MKLPLVVDCYQPSAVCHQLPAKHRELQPFAVGQLRWLMAEVVRVDRGEG